MGKRKRSARAAGHARRPIRPTELVRPGVAGAIAAVQKRGLAAAALAAVAGTIAGAIAAYWSGETHGSAAYAARLDLRDAPLAGAGGERSKLIAALANDDGSERLTPITSDRTEPASKPRLIIIVDDMGLGRAAYDAVMALPGPLTLSFLPYADDLQRMADGARSRGDAVLLHLPMEPAGGADPGPHSLSASMDQQELFNALSWNLSRFDGFVGVNNHMGSKFTRDPQAMKRVLAYLRQRNLFFIDSVTTGSSVAAEAGAAVGAEVYARDVFLDAEPGAEFVRRQLALAEEIARKTGYAVVICHPREATLAALGPWLTTAPARGFELATVEVLADGDAGRLAAAR